VRSTLRTHAFPWCHDRPAAGRARTFFGRNAVQWERLESQVLKTDHFDVLPPAEASAAEQAGRLAERWRQQGGAVRSNRDLVRSVAAWRA
jgi:hypothetical protein